MVVNYKVIAFFENEILSLDKFQQFLNRSFIIINVMVADIMFRSFNLSNDLMIRSFTMFFLGGLSSTPSALKINGSYFNYHTYIASPFYKKDPKGILLLSLIASSIPAELDFSKDIFSKLVINGSRYPIELEHGRTLSSIVVPLINMILLMGLQKMAETRVNMMNELKLKGAIQNNQSIDSVILSSIVPNPFFDIFKTLSISMSAYLGILFNGLVLIDHSIIDGQENDALKRSIKYIVSFLYCFYPTVQFRNRHDIKYLIQKKNVYKVLIKEHPSKKKINRLFLMEQFFQYSLSSLYFSHHILTLDDPNTILNHTFIFWITSSFGTAVIIYFFANKYLRSNIELVQLFEENNVSVDAA